MQIEKNSAVSIHYHLTEPSGAVLDSSRGRQPMEYLHGHGNLVSGVERALVGQPVGAKIQVEVSPEDGYGAYDPALDISVPLSVFPAEVRPQIQPGAMFEGPHPSDNTRGAAFTVLEVLESEVRCTANHPLAGRTLHFEVEVIDIRTATSDEISQGQVLPPGWVASSGCCNDPDCDK